MGVEQLVTRFEKVRARTLSLTRRLELEDYMVQSMPDASPPRWHLAHTTWFFDVFVLDAFVPGYATRDMRWRQLFNSYYHGVGDQFPRALRGTQSRPTVREILSWRHEINRQLVALLRSGQVPFARLAPVIELGLQHEQQHQELLVTDIKHGFCTSPMKPTLVDGGPAPFVDSGPRWVSRPGGLVSIGHEGPGFAYDNEGPAHHALLHPHRLARNLITCGEYLAFIEDGGYTRPELWLSDGWARLGAEGWTAPLYWCHLDGVWQEETLGGSQPLQLGAPVCHVSFFEADAFARWAGHRLPTEFEWEAAARLVQAQPDGTMADDGFLHPVGSAAPAVGGLRHLLGEVWEWTSSAYLPYPGYRPAAGAIGEYNGKFMSGQMVLRGGSCATPRGHERATYRNFFQPEKRWQFSGIRLAANPE